MCNLNKRLLNTSVPGAAVWLSSVLCSFTQSYLFSSG